MRDILILGVFLLVLYVFFKIMVKEPILPWKEKKTSQKKHVKDNRKKKSGSQTNEGSEPFPKFLSKVKSVKNHMIELENHKFVMIAEVTPVNYFLLSQDEQEAIDSRFETWLAQINYPVQFYLQNRYVDLSEPVEQIQEVLKNDPDLNQLSIEYGNTLIKNLNDWQNRTPRYETKRYLVFPYQVQMKDIQADDEEEFDERVTSKAFNELYRRLNTAKGSLSKANMEVELLTSEGIAETLYYAFNRKRAIQNKFKDISNKEKLALYVTANKTDAHIERVKEMINDEFAQNEEKERVYDERQENIS